MNIAIFTNNYLPNPYGVTGSIESFRRQFEKRGHSVFIFAPFYKDYEDKNPNVFRYPAVDIEFKIKFPLAIPYSRKMDKVISRLNLDIIHSQHPNLLGTAAAKWAKKKKVPLIFTWHALYDQYVHFATIVPSKLAAKYIINKAVRYANAADFVITPTESVGEIIKNWGVKNKNIKAIATGVDIENFGNYKRDIVRKKYGIKENEILLLLAARLTQEKNVGFVLDSLITLIENKENVKFLIVGEGNQVPELKRKVKDNNLEEKIIFAGIAKRDVLENYYAAGDIFVYASKSETQGMVITEAMYMGLPIVAVNATGICNLVENNVNGFLVDENKAIFSGAVDKLIQNKELREKFGSESARIAREKYTDEACAKMMLEVYKKAIELKVQNSKLKTTT